MDAQRANEPRRDDAGTVPGAEEEPTSSVSLEERLLLMLGQAPERWLELLRAALATASHPARHGPPVFEGSEEAHREMQRWLDARGESTHSPNTLDEVVQFVSERFGRLAFVLAVGRLPGIRSISAGSKEQAVDFVVRVDGGWADAIGRIEPAIRSMRISGQPFDYTVFEAHWRHPDPAGYRVIYETRS